VNVRQRRFGSIPSRSTTSRSSPSGRAWPRHYKDYVHRTGRAARRGRAGRCASFAGPGEYLAMRNLEQEFPGPLPIHPAFANRDAWFRDAKRLHDHKVSQGERADQIRREQGLDKPDEG